MFERCCAVANGAGLTVGDFRLSFLSSKVLLELSALRFFFALSR